MSLVCLAAIQNSILFGKETQRNSRAKLYIPGEMTKLAKYIEILYVFFFVFTIVLIEKESLPLQKS